MSHTILTYLIIILLVAAFLLSYKRKCDSELVNTGGYYVSANTSLALKGICAIILICTHWCTYNFHLLSNKDSLFYNFIMLHGGHFVIIIFMFLSGYGIAKVETTRRLSIKDYFAKRVWKILKPAWIISFITLLLYIFFGPRNISMEVVGENWLHIYMSQISHRAFSVFFFVKYFTLHLDWYVFTTLVLYILFWLALHASKEKARMLSVLYFLTFVYYCIGQLLDFPAHYYRNLWSFPLGVTCALWPDWVKNKRLLSFSVLVFVLNLIIEGQHYAVSAFMALAVLMGVGYTNLKYEISSKTLFYLGGISYPVYLIHRTVYNLQWTYDALNFPLFILITIVSSICFKNIMDYFKSTQASLLT